MSLLMLGLLMAGCGNENRRNGNGSTGDAVNRPAFEVPSPDVSQLPRALVARLEEKRSIAVAQPSDSRAIGEYGMMLYSFEFPSEAALCFSQCTTLEPDGLRWHYYLALARHDIPDRSNAIHALRRCIALDESYVPFWNLLGAWNKGEDFTQAEEAYQQAYQLDRLDATANFGLGQLAQQNEDSPSAIEFYKRAIQGAPDFADAHYALAMLLVQSGQSEQAQWHLAQHAVGGPPPETDPLIIELKAFAPHPKTLFGAATQLVERGRLNEAQTLLNECLELDPDNVLYQNLNGFVFLRKKLYTEAAIQFEQALKSDPDSFKAKSNLAEVQMALGRVPRAERLLREALGHDPRHSASLRRLGLLLLRSSRAEESIRFLEELNQVSPGLAQFQIELALAYATAREFDRMALQLKNVSDLAETGFVSQLIQLVNQQGQYNALPSGFKPLTSDEFDTIAVKLKEAGLHEESHEAAVHAASFGSF